MNDDKNFVGNLIASARKKKNFTQQELAKLLNVSDKTVSAWETGKNYPDLGLIKNISKYLDIDLISILANKKNNRFKKNLKIFGIVVAIILVGLFIYFGIYYFNNFNRIKVYEVTFDSKDYNLNNGLVVVSPEKVIFSLGEITGVDEEFDITLYYIDVDKKEEIVSKFNYNYLYYETTNDFILKEDDLNKIKIEMIYYVDGKKNEEEISLKFEEKASSDKLFYKTGKHEIDESDDRLKVLLHNLGYKKSSNNIYVKEYKDKDLTYNYDLDNDKFSYSYMEEDLEKKGIYNINNNEIYFYVFYNDYVVEEFFYENDEVICTLGKCSDSENMINLLLDEYKKLK